MSSFELNETKDHGRTKVQTSQPDERLVGKLNQITGMEWLQNLEDDIVLSSINEETIRSIIKLLPVEIWNAVVIHDNYITVPRVYIGFVLEIISEQYELYTGDVDPIQISEIGKLLNSHVLNSYDVKADKVIFISDYQMELPERLSEVIEIIPVDHDLFGYIVTMDTVSLLYNYLTQDFPLFEPINKQDITDKFINYVSAQIESSLKKIYNVIRTMSENGIDISIHRLSRIRKMIHDHIIVHTGLNENSIYIQGSNTYLEYIMRAIMNIIRTSFPDLPIDGEHDYIQADFLGNIELKNIFDIYHHLWLRFIGESSVKAHLDEYVPFPVSDLQNLIGEYYSNLNPSQ